MFYASYPLQAVRDVLLDLKKRTYCTATTLRQATSMLQALAQKPSFSTTDAVPNFQPTILRGRLADPYVEHFASGHDPVTSLFY